MFALSCAAEAECRELGDLFRLGSHTQETTDLEAYKETIGPQDLPQSSTQSESLTRRKRLRILFLSSWRNSLLLFVPMDSWLMCTDEYRQVAWCARFRCVDCYCGCGVVLLERQEWTAYVELINAWMYRRTRDGEEGSDSRWRSNIQIECKITYMREALLIVCRE